MNIDRLFISAAQVDLAVKNALNKLVDTIDGATPITSTLAAPGTINALSAAAVLGVSTTGTLSTVDGIRGAVTVPTGKSAGDQTYLYGVTGRLTVAGTLAVGSAQVAAGFFKADFNGATLTSGHVAAVSANIVNPPAGTSAVLDLFYGESASGNIINSMFKGYAASTYVFDLTSVAGGQLSTAAVTSGTAAGFLKVLVNGEVRYINLFSGAPA